MKKKILGIVITLVIMIGMVASQANAAQISANNTEVNVGDQVTVTVNLNEPTHAIDLTLEYNANNFRFESVNSSIGDLTTNASQPGRVLISKASATNTTSSITYTFVATALTEDAAAEFVASGIVTENGEPLDIDTVEVSVVEPAEEPTQPEDPTQPENPAEDPAQEPTTGEETQTGNEENVDAPLVDENGNVITKLPQTGVNVYTVIAGVAVVAIVAVFAVRKIRK